MDPLLGKYDPICCMVWPKFFNFFFKVKFFIFILIKYMSVLRPRLCFVFSTFGGTLP